MRFVIVQVSQNVVAVRMLGQINHLGFWSNTNIHQDSLQPLLFEGCRVGGQDDYWAYGEDFLKVKLGTLGYQEFVILQTFFLGGRDGGFLSHSRKFSQSFIFGKGINNGVGLADDIVAGNWLTNQGRGSGGVDGGVRVAFGDGEKYENIEGTECQKTCHNHDEQEHGVQFQLGFIVWRLRLFDIDVKRRFQGRVSSLVGGHFC